MTTSNTNSKLGAAAMTNAELDRLIAEKCMGWTSGVTPSGLNVWVTREWVDQHENSGPVTGRTQHSWHPTEDISQAFEAVEKIMELGWQFELRVANGYVNHVRLWSNNLEKSIDQKGGTAPEAICRAIEAVLDAQSSIEEGGGDE